MPAADDPHGAASRVPEAATEVVILFRNSGPTVACALAARRYAVVPRGCSAGGDLVFSGERRAVDRLFKDLLALRESREGDQSDLLDFEAGVFPPESTAAHPRLVFGRRTMPHREFHGAIRVLLPGATAGLPARL